MSGNSAAHCNTKLPRVERQSMGYGGSDSDNNSDLEIKTGPICIINQHGSGLGQKKAHLKVVKDDLSLSAHFYTDSDESYEFGLLSVSKCIISKSTSDLRVIEVGQSDKTPGMLIKTKSEADANEWLRALTSDINIKS